MAINLANPVNWQSPLNRNREAWWLAVGAPYSDSNTWTDLTKRHQVNPGSGSEWRKYRQGLGYLNFAGVVGANATSATTLNYSRSFTLSAIIWYTGSAANQGVISKGNGGHYLRIASNKVNILQSQTVDIFSGSTSVPASTWSHVAVTIDASGNGTVYLNGRSDGTFSTAVTFNGNQGLSLGSDRSGGGTSSEFLVGYISDASIYSRCLSADEMYVLYRDSLLQYYPLTLTRTKPGFVTSPPAAPSFKSAWARGSNVILQPGVLT